MKRKSRLRKTLKYSYQSFIEPIARFAGTFRNFFPYKISIPSETNKNTENVLLLAPIPQEPEPEPVHRGGPDLVLVVNTHGETCTEACSITNRLYAMEKTIQGINITLLERVPCGVLNVGLSYGDKDLMEYLQSLVVDLDEHKIMMDFYPQILQTVLQVWVQKLDLGVYKDLLADPEFEAFKKEKGWRIVGRKTSEGFTYLERNYATDDKYTSVNVLYAKPGSPFTKGTNLLKSNVITRSELFRIAKYTDHHNIIVLDTSCGVFSNNELTHAQSAELTAYYKAIGLAGGKKRKRKTKKK